MTTIKVSELPVVTIPYDGSEYTLGIQNGMSVKVPALNLAAATGASLIGTIPSGTLAASTVAASLTELDREKASTAALSSGLALKADTSTVNSQLSFKADTFTVNSQLALKANTSTVNSQLAVKVDTSALSASTGSTLVGTIQSGTGAVSRTVASKLNDVVSVKDFGAVGDGVTDDSAAFIAALAYVETLGGGNLYIAADNYYINANITVPSGCVIVGELALTSPRAYNPNLFNYSQLLLGAGCTINLGQAAGITGCCIVRKGIT